MIQDYQPPRNHCAWCGKFWEPPDYGDLFPRCRACFEDETYKKRALFLVKESAEPPVVRFAQVFKTARVLLDNDAGEDQILPTLACEALQARDSDKGTLGGQWTELEDSFLEAWKTPGVWDSKSRELLEKTGRIRPVEVVDGALILERAPVAVKVWGGSEPEVWIEIMPRSKPATPEEVASSYERAMRDHGVPFQEDRAVSVTCILTEHHLRLRLKPVFVGFYISDSPPREPFPSPTLVEDVYRGLRQGRLGERLTGRSRGRAWKPHNLVPATVAFYLRTYGGVEGRKEINKLLNHHVLDAAGRSLAVGHSDSASNQLWRDIRTIHGQLVRTMHSL
jgi:hypothetical protein